MSIPSPLRRRFFPTALAVSALLLACTACSAGGPPPGSSDHSSGNSSSSDSSSGNSDNGSSSDNSGDNSSGESSGDSSTVGGSGDAADTPFCIDLNTDPPASDDDSDEAKMQQTVDYWQKAADDAPPSMKAKVSAIADGYRKIAAGDTSASTDQSWVNNVSDVAQYLVDHC